MLRVVLAYKPNESGKRVEVPCFICKQPSDHFPRSCPTRGNQHGSNPRANAVRSLSTASWARASKMTRLLTNETSDFDRNRRDIFHQSKSKVNSY